MKLGRMVVGGALWDKSLASTRRVQSDRVREYGTELVRSGFGRRRLLVSAQEITW